MESEGKRNKFYFYRSYLNSVNNIERLEDKLDLLIAIIKYSLDDEEPNNLSNNMKAIFECMRFNLNYYKERSIKYKLNASKKRKGKNVSKDRDSFEKEIQRSISNNCS